MNYLAGNIICINSYLGIKNGEVFLLGEAFGPGVNHFDTVENTLQLLESLISDFDHCLKISVQAGEGFANREFSPFFKNITYPQRFSFRANI